MWLLTIGLVYGSPLSLDDALLAAFADNLELQQQRHGVTLARHRLNVARAGFDPQLTAGVSTNRSATPTNDVTDGADILRSQSTSWSVGLEQALPSGGSVGARISEFTNDSNSQNASSNVFWTDNLSLSFNQPLLRGLTGGALQQLRDAHLDAAQAELTWRSQQESKFLEVTVAYWNLLSAREQLIIAVRSHELAEEQLRQTLERQTAGFAGSGDVLQVKVLVGGAQRQELFARANVNSAALRLARLMGRPLAEAEEVELSDRPTVPNTFPTVEQLAARAVAGNAGFLSATIDFERARRAATRARINALPAVNLNASAGFSAGATTATAVRQQLVTSPAGSVGVGVNVALPLIPREAAARLGMATLSLEQAELQLEAAEQDLHIDVVDAVRTIERDVASLTAAAQTLEFALASLDAQKELLAEGRGSTRDVINALESLRSAQASELDARIAVQRSLQASARLTGDLLPE